MRDPYAETNLIILLLIVTTLYNTFVPEPIPTYTDRTTNKTVQLVAGICVNMTFYDADKINIYLLNHDTPVASCEHENICNVCHVIDDYKKDNFTIANYKLVFSNAETNIYPIYYENYYVPIYRQNNGCYEEMYMLYRLIELEI